MTTKQRSKTTKPAGRRLPLALIGGAVFTVLLIVTVFLTLEGETDDRPDEYGSPTVTGALPVLADSTADPAMGTSAPEVTGQSFDGTEISITADGTAKAIVFLAHWCPFCQEELPWVSDWLAENGTPAGVDVYAVATAISRNRENWPPSEWLEREGFDGPILVDDEANSIANAFGLPAYPYWVFVDADGNVAGRVSGGITPDDLAAVLATLARS